MSDLEPWKIWAVTGILVYFILGSASLHVRPPAVDEATAQASTLTADERASDGATESVQSTDQFDDYFPAFSHATFNRADYSSSPTTSIMPASGLLFASASLSNPIDDSNLDPELDVTQQILGNDIPQADAVALLETDQMANRVVPWFPATVYPPTLSRWDVDSYNGLAVTTDDAMELAWQDAETLASQITNNLVNVRIQIDTPGSLGVIDFSGSNSAPALYAVDRTSLGRMLLDSDNSDTEITNLVPMSATRDDSYAIQVLDELRMQAVNAATEDEALNAAEEVQAERAIVQQQAMAAYARTVGRAHLEMAISQQE